MKAYGLLQQNYQMRRFLLYYTYCRSICVPHVKFQTYVSRTVLKNCSEDIDIWSFTSFARDLTSSA